MIKEEVRLAEEISNYLRKNPGAGDTLEGITTWWLDLEQGKQSVRKVTAAMEILMDKGLIRKRRIPGGTILYKSNMKRKEKKEKK